MKRELKAMNYLLGLLCALVEEPFPMKRELKGASRYPGSPAHLR